jgi:hypothetical protein
VDSNAAPEAGTLSSFARANSFLAGVAILATGCAIYGTKLNERQFVRVEDVLGAVKVPISQVMLIAMAYNGMAMGLLIALATVGAIASSLRGGRVGTLYLNVATIVTALSWWAFHSTALYLFTVTMMEMFGRRR